MDCKGHYRLKSWDIVQLMYPKYDKGHHNFSLLTKYFKPLYCSFAISCSSLKLIYWKDTVFGNYFLVEPIRRTWRTLNYVVLWIVGTDPILEEGGWDYVIKFLEDTMSEPSRLKWTAETGSEWAGRFFNCFPVFTSQIRTDSSKLPDTIKLDCGLNPQHKT